ncbi:phage integrase family protein [Paraburkholderia xenovorans LB400]|uniref:Phage integrase n=1 Tax=Paraburkholderia xenovorans (strain LB400) TaxID=266265 RepID=Q13W63_PARXL|nr:site-specific integrase [Paraburkholderia xenovorans]ABE31676.1 Putative phage integrase [Paraburkholderia xenovorans LB400]AIP30651.1 phage integrase family protein [Paraburkholderia xenovorans LB400]
MASKLTVKELEALKPADIGTTIRDEGGIWGRVRKAGDGVSVTFWYRYKWQAKTRDTAIGTWPAASLPKIRKNRDAARALVKDGRDPNEQREIDRRDREAAEALRKAEALTVSDLYDAWFPTISVKRGKRGRKDEGKEIERTFNLFVLKKIGTKLLTTIYKSDVQPILTRISDGGANRQATALLTDLKQMFRWGDQNQPYKRLLAASDVLAIKPEDIVSGDYDPVADNERTRVLTEAEIRQLAKLVPAADLPLTTRAAIWIMLSCGTRIGETVATKWAHVDLQTGRWSIPKEHTKSGVALEVALSDFALAQFQTLADARDALPVEDRSDYVFPSRNDRTKPLNNQAVGKQLADRQRTSGEPIKGRTEKVDALALDGGQWRCHDLRRTAGTLMQSLGVPESIVHRCLNHARSDKLDRVYLQHDYSKEMAEAWAALGVRLQALKTDNVLTLPNASVA